MWEKFGVTRTMMGLPPLSAIEVDRRIQVVELIEHYKHTEQEKAIAKAQAEAKMRGGRGTYAPPPPPSR